MLADSTVVWPTVWRYFPISDLHALVLRVWRDTFQELHGIVFLVDCASYESYTRSKDELHTLLSIDKLSKVPFLVLGNKIDAPGATSQDELRVHLGLEKTTGKVGLCIVWKLIGYP
jgi:GTP-binding protein SAR1